MPDQTDFEGIGGQIGYEATEHGDRHAAEICARERQRRETKNQPTIMALRAKIALLQVREQDLLNRISKALPPIEAALRRRKALFYWALVALLSISGFAFAVLTFEPFRIGAKGWLYSIAASLILPVLTDVVFELRGSPKFITNVVTGAWIAGLISLVLLAVIRAELFFQQMHSTTASVVFNTDAPVAPQTENTFYQGTIILLGIVMVGLAVAMEIGIGYFIYQARRWGRESEEATALQKELVAVREEMIRLGEDLRTNEIDGAVWEDNYWRDYAREKLNGANSTARRVAVALLCLALLVHGRAFAQGLNLVAEVDLTASVSGIGPDNKTDFDKNLAAVSRLLAAVPAGAKVTIVGITAQSFNQPYVLLSAELSPDAGYFQERLAAARNQLLRAWQQKTVQLNMASKQTDLLGALMLCSQILRQDGRKNVLVIFSDMRQHTPVLDLERPNVINPDEALDVIERQHLISNLKGVDVYVLGADAGGKSLEYWQGLRDFWSGYFAKAGAHVRGYSVLRESPNLQ